MTPIYKYEPNCDVDLLIARMWAQMKESGDLGRLFRSDTISLSAFYEFSQGPNHELVYCLDDDGIWLAAWFDRFLHGALMSAWVRPDMRGALIATLAFRRVLIGGCIAYHTIIGVTRKELLEVHEALGYTLVGAIPNLMGGEDGYVLFRVATEQEIERWQRAQQREREAAQAASPLAQGSVDRARSLERARSAVEPVPAAGQQPQPASATSSQAAAHPLPLSELVDSVLSRGRLSA